MVDKPVIFISHSARSDPPSLQLIHAIHDTLADSGTYEPFLDKEILRSGQEWRKQLTTYLNLCQGAVLVLNQTALEQDLAKVSAWVYREATILSYRQARQPSFPLLIVPCGIERSSVKDHPLFRTMNLDETQFVSPRDDQGRDRDPKQIVAEVVDRLGQMAPALAIEAPFARTLAPIVRGLTALSHDVLRDAGIRADIDVTRWDLIAEREAAARELAVALFESDFQRFGEIVAQLVESRDRDLLETILRLVPPFLWVAPEAGDTLGLVCKRSRGPRFACINGEDSEFTPEQYIRRAHGEIVGWPLVGISGVHGESVATELADQIRSGLKAHFERSLADWGRPMPVGEGQLGDLSAWLRRAGKPLVIPLYLPGVNAEIVAAIEYAFPDVSFILLTGADLPGPSACDKLTLIYPPLGREHEAQARLDVQGTRLIVATAQL